MKKILFGPQTIASLENFPFDYPIIHKEFIVAMVMLKKAAAYANEKARKITKAQLDGIQKACDEILSGKYDDQFLVSSIHGGAGTSINMNVNEVIATLSDTHANDHVNASQSTNDINPSALKIAVIILTNKLLINIDSLIGALDLKAKKYKKNQKLGRTHMQDAVPTTFGAEFASYRDIIKRDKKRIEDALSYMYELNIGGTAIGDSTNAPKIYIKTIYAELCKITGIKKLKPLRNFMSGTSSGADFCGLSGAIDTFCIDLSKIATDFRFMSSGPRGGIGEITFKKLQPGSSIMPGKVNPIICETINQIHYQVAGMNLTIQLAAEGAHMELGIMLPAIVDSLIVMIKMVTTGTSIFTHKGVNMIVVNSERGKELLEQSTAYSTLLTRRFGYDTVSHIVHEAIETKCTLREVVLKRKLLTDEEFNKEISIIS